MKKRVLATLMSVSLVAALLVGCGDPVQHLHRHQMIRPQTQRRLQVILHLLTQQQRTQQQRTQQQQVEITNLKSSLRATSHLTGRQP